MAYCHVAHDCVIGDNVIMSNAVQVAGEVVIDNHAVIGGGALIHQFSHIGQHVMLQGGALVNKDIPPYVKAGRNPISYAGINSIAPARVHQRADTRHTGDIQVSLSVGDE
jgi:UDP-N-acetylglucosamine acyltransferase